MNYREQQIRQMWRNDLANKTEQWSQERNVLQNDITILQNSVDVAIVENLTGENKNQAKQIKALTLLANQRKQELEQEKQALITLARQKIKNQKQAQELLTQLEQNWNNEKNQLTEENQELQEQLNQKDAENKHQFSRIKEEMKKVQKLTEKLTHEQNQTNYYQELFTKEQAANNQHWKDKGELLFIKRPGSLVPMRVHWSPCGNSVSLLKIFQTFFVSISRATITVWFLLLNPA